MAIGVHMCRGNAMGKWMASGGYERIAEEAFGALEVDAFFLEYDTARAGGFEPLRFVPGGQIRRAWAREHQNAASRVGGRPQTRIDEASRYVPLERLGLSPQCGFASRDLGTALTFADQEAKLRLVVETAVAVWGK